MLMGQMNVSTHPAQKRPQSADVPDNQFHMTVLGSSGTTGRVHFPYQPANDNHYAISSTNKDILQCRVEVTRTSGDYYDATVYNVNANAQGTDSDQSTTDQQSFTILGGGDLLDLAIIRTGQMGQADTVGSRVDFNHGAAGFMTFELGTDFFWTTVSQGTNTNVTFQISC